MISLLLMFLMLFKVKQTGECQIEKRRRVGGGGGNSGSE